MINHGEVTLTFSMSLNELITTTFNNIIKAHISINILTCINFNKVALTSQNTVGT